MNHEVEELERLKGLENSGPENNHKAQKHIPVDFCRVKRRKDMDEERRTSYGYC